jgi:hypothetical protein
LRDRPARAASVAGAEALMTGRALIESLVDLRDLRDPSLTLGVLERQDLVVRPVKVIGNVRYLLIEPL